jgi:hypothetical protein
MASGDITVDGSNVLGASGSNSGVDFVGQVYYDLAGAGYNYCGVTGGGAARINYSGGVFSVDSGFENHPVTYVSWYGATSFCNYYGYRLPTEWEWKAVADYDGSYPYPCGPNINNSIANYCGSTHPYGTTSVGAFGTYGYGMCDMAGNVWEWTSSLCDPPQDGRTQCGCCWANLGQDLATVWKTCDHPYRTDGTLGFRVAMTPEPDPIQAILAFIEKSVADGNLVPVKPGKAGEGQLGALINMIETAGNLIDANDPNLLADVCGQLHAALGKTDGQDPPPDFVTGEATAELAQRIEELMVSLGCE